MTTAPNRIGIFGGTFDPIHLGHLIAATEMRHALRLDRVLFVPAARPPHKSTRHVSDDTHRLAMLRLVLTDNPAFGISTIELDRPGPSYTSDTLAALSTMLAPASLVFLMGEDSLRDLPTWHQPDRIVSLAVLGVATRPGVVADLDAVFQAVPPARDRIRLVQIPLIGIEATDIRRRVAAGEPIRYQVPPPVEDYIRRHNLYRS